MRGLFAISAVLLLAVLAEAQPRPAVMWGAEFKARKNSSLRDIVGYDNSGIYAIKERYRIGRTKYTLVHYDQRLFPARSLPLDFRENGVERRVEMILQLRNRLYLFTSIPDDRSKRKTLAVQEINKKTLRPEGSMVPIADFDFAGGRPADEGKFHIEVSRDSSKILVVYTIPSDKNEPKVFGMAVLDDMLAPQWSKEVALPYESRLLDLESFRVGNNGDAYLLGLIYNGRRQEKHQGAPNYRYHIFAYSDGGETMSEYPVVLPDKFITDMQIEVLDSRGLICAGFYSEKGTFSIRGTYFLTIDAETKEVKTRSLREFGIDFITQHMRPGRAARARRKEERGKGTELYKYDLRRLLVGKDGSGMLLAEQYFVTVSSHSSTVNGYNETRRTWSYSYGDIIAVKIDPSGQIRWAEKIAKQQQTTNDDGFFSSYAMGIVNGNICFMFNDDPRNVSYLSGHKLHYFAGQRRSAVMMVTLDPSGKQKRQLLVGARDTKVLIRPKVCEQVTNREVILFGQWRKRQQFARVLF